MLDCPQYRQLAAGEPRFADAVDAFVSIYYHKQKVSLPAPYRICLDTGNLHTYLQVPLPNDGTRGICFEQSATRYRILGGWQDDPAPGVCAATISIEARRP